MRGQSQVFSRVERLEPRRKEASRSGQTKQSPLPQRPRATIHPIDGPLPVPIPFRWRADHAVLFCLTKDLNDLRDAKPIFVHFFHDGILDSGSSRIRLLRQGDHGAASPSWSPSDPTRSIRLQAMSAGRNRSDRLPVQKPTTNHRLNGDKGSITVVLPADVVPPLELSHIAV